VGAQLADSRRRRIAGAGIPAVTAAYDPATTGLYEAVVNRRTHSGDRRLARHVGNATVRTDNRGTRIYEEHKQSARRIDLAVCAITANSVATTISPVQLYWLRRREKAGSR
jgi:hypothetical protein